MSTQLSIGQSFNLHVKNGTTTIHAIPPGTTSRWYSSDPTKLKVVALGGGFDAAATALAAGNAQVVFEMTFGPNSFNLAPVILKESVTVVQPDWLVLAADPPV